MQMQRIATTLILMVLMKVAKGNILVTRRDTPGASLIAAREMTNLDRNGLNVRDDRATTRGLADRLRRVGQRVTPQRLVILGALQQDAHLTADEVFARVEPLLPGVNRSTVYRTLELFRDLGLASMTDLGGGARQFELIDDPHHHLICHRCGVILELDDDLVDPLRQRIRERYGFAPGIDHLALFGYCTACERAADGEERAAPDGP
jgi:Fur family ferric uptake transcriptional regulator